MGRVAKDKSKSAKRYRAPALEKGLDILELVSRSSTPLSAVQITQKLGRSVGELFRMVQVLEYRGFIEQAPNGQGFVPTSKLFSLGMEQVPNKTLLEMALPVMRNLSQEIDQSCHLAVRAAGDIVVVARMESAGLIGFTVRVGYRRAIPLSGSGSVLYAFQADSVRKHWEEQFDPSISAKVIEKFRKHADAVVAQGYDMRPSDVVSGIVDVSAPILHRGIATAALTVPFVEKPSRVKIEEVANQVRASAAEISSSLIVSEFRV